MTRTQWPAGHSKGADQAGAIVDLESMSTPMRKKSPKLITPKSTKSKGKKATFALEELVDAAKKKDEKETTNFQCVIGVLLTAYFIVTTS
jgi:hypothetical protein